MKKLIEESRLKLKEFAELYNIPYNTVRQWYNEERKCPQYIKSMVIQISELKSKGKQLPIKTGTCYYVIEIDRTDRKFLKIYEKDSISYNADKNFWEAEAKKPLKYPPQVRSFEVMEI